MAVAVVVVLVVYFQKEIRKDRMKCAAFEIPKEFEENELVVVLMQTNHFFTFYFIAVTNFIFLGF